VAESVKQPPAPAKAAPKEPKAPTVAAAGPLPRVVDPIERAPAGATRYKIRAEVPGFPTRTLYVLAKDQASAEKCYREAAKLAEQEKYLDDASKAAVRLVVTVLPD